MPATEGTDRQRTALVEQVASALADADVAYGHGTGNPHDEAVRMVADTAADAMPALRPLLARRIGDRVPLPYLSGVAWLVGVRFAVRPGVVIPRSPIAQALTRGLRPWLAKPPRRVLDLCCGSGALGLVAARVFPRAEVDLVDVDAAALAVAKENAAAAGAPVASRIRVIASDIFAELRGRRYDLVLCNPPYVPTAELDAAPPEFHHEPRRGLHGGPDGLAVWRRIVPRLDAHLCPGGVLVGEAGNVGEAFDRAFPALGAVWLDLNAEPQAGGGFGVFVSSSALRRGGGRPSPRRSSPSAGSSDKTSILDVSSL